MVRRDQRIQVSDHEFLAGGKRVAQQVLDYGVHQLGMKDVSDQRHQHQQERKERQDGVGGDGEGEGVHLGLEEIARGGTQDAFGRSGVQLGRSLLVGKLDGSDGRHWFLKYYQILTVFRRGTPVPAPTACLIEARGHVHFSAYSHQFRSCQPQSSCYDLVLRQPDPVGECAAGLGVSVPAVRYRAFVFSAPRNFVAGNRPAECRGAVCVRAVWPARGDASKKFLSLL